MRTQLDAAQGLLTKARNDLFAAKTVIATGEALDTVAFHAQQAAEKSFKALLILRSIEYPLTHDVAALLELVLKHDAALALYEPDMEKFAPYGVVVRYDVFIYPTPATARELVDIAQRIYDYAQSVVASSETCSE